MAFKPPKKDINKMVGSLNERLAEKYGKPVIYHVKEAPHRGRFRIPFTSHILNRLSGGGVLVPRIHQIYGPEGVFKSTGLYDLIANGQKMRDVNCVGEFERCRLIVLLDSEFGANEQYMRQCGVDVDDPELVIIDNYESADQAVDIMVDLLKSKEVMLLGIDSISTLQSQREEEQDTADLIKLQGWSGKFTSGMFKKLHNANQGLTAIVFVNQIRDVLGDRLERITLDKSGYTPTGGWAPRYYPSLTIELQHAAEEREEKPTKIPAPVRGDRERKALQSWVISARVEKTRMAGNDQQELFFRYIPGAARIDHETEILNLGRLDGFITIAGGGYYKYKLKGMKEWEVLGQGQENARLKLIKDRKLYDKMVKVIDAKTLAMTKGED